ncbi:4Fe-4S dicluster domain-containing protein [Adlercreutzia sp. ZJ141]|uniref:4Fe-4S dicluster domain-containing protein n=1 Tax=Adlercreutzia sp. ZJ141 TaxID=2709406 RepID=UPI0013E9B67C|nr:4Fe-4S dicluster domain-containing protein [Adlercreutzia sp. ZJ141]
MAHYAIAVDTKRCIGCWSCGVACKLENNIPNDVFWNRTLTVGGDQPNTPSGEYGNCQMSFTPVQCNHCDNPACVAACPTGATYKDEETGIVMQNGEECIGCKTCIESCPYEGVRTLLADEPQWFVDFPVGNQLAPEHPGGTVEKCNLCYFRVADGKVPACVEGCPAHARFFGDLDDPESDVSKLLAERENFTLLPEEGTGPNIYYLS